MKLYKSMGTLFVFSMLALIPAGCEEDYMSITNPKTEQKANTYANYEIDWADAADSVSLKAKPRSSASLDGAGAGAAGVGGSPPASVASTGDGAAVSPGIGGVRLLPECCGSSPGADGSDSMAEAAGSGSLLDDFHSFSIISAIPRMQTAISMPIKALFMAEAPLAYWLFLGERRCSLRIYCSMRA